MRTHSILAATKRFQYGEERRLVLVATPNIQVAGNSLFGRFVVVVVVACRARTTTLTDMARVFWRHSFQFGSRSCKQSQILNREKGVQLQAPLIPWRE